MNYFNFGMVVLFASIILQGPSAWAATLLVNTEAQNSAMPGDCTLSQAIDSANADVPVGGCVAEAGSQFIPGGADTVMVPAGTYLLTTVNDPAEDGNAFPAITSEITITGEGRNSTFLQRESGSPEFRLFLVENPAVLVLEGLTLQGGSVEAASAPGGAIFFNGAALTLTNSRVIQNISGQIGGGIFQNSGALTLVDTIIQENEALGSSGGGGGGGLFLLSGTANIDRSTVAQNRVLNDSGGGILNFNGDITIQNSTISGNFAGNADGGGISHRSSDPSKQLIILNSTIGDNQATGDGGGVDHNSDGTTVIENSTISDNLAGQTGGGVRKRVSGTVTLKNTIVAANKNLQSGGNSPDCNNEGTISSDGFNLIGNDTGCDFDEIPGEDLVGTGDAPIDPELGALQNNGGDTDTFLLASTSRARDAGGDCPPPDQDQRDIFRPQGPACDIGAVEFSPGTVQFSMDSFDASAADAVAVIPVNRTGGTDAAGSVDVVVSGGSAIEGTDFALLNPTLSFPQGSASQDLTVILRSNFEGTKTVNLTLVNPTEDMSLGNPFAALLTINGTGTGNGCSLSKDLPPSRINFMGILLATLFLTLISLRFIPPWSGRSGADGDGGPRGR